MGSREERANDAPVSVFVASCLFTAGLAFSVDFSRRLFGGGPDTGSVMGTALQAFFAVVAGSTFTSTGREFVGRFFHKLRLRSPSLPHVALWASLLFFVCALGMWQFAPKQLSTAYNWRGLKLEHQSLGGAIDAYQRAISLWPENADAHYNLGRMYESALMSKEAIAQYREVTTINSRYVLAFSNMGRLLIIDGKLMDAMRMLDAGAKGSSGDPYEDVPLFKNRGWANLEMGFLRDAKSDLNRSLVMKRTAAAECVLAKTYMKENDGADANKTWALFRTDFPAQQSDPYVPKVEPDCTRLAEEKP